jgi:hypothetical protein
LCGTKIIEVEPARMSELAVAGNRGSTVGLSLEAEHQRRWERPRLRGDVMGRVGLDPRFLAHLANERLLRGLAGQDEAGRTEY